MSLMNNDIREEYVRGDEKGIGIFETAIKSSAESLCSNMLECIFTVVNQLHNIANKMLENEKTKSRFWEDSSKLAFFGLLFVLSYLVFAPIDFSRNRAASKKASSFASWLFCLIRRFFSGEKISWDRFDTVARHLRRTRSDSESVSLYSSKRRSNSLSSCIPDYLMDDDESDEEIFARNWQTIYRSEYHRLVLPPICKVVEKPKSLLRKEEKPTPKAKRSKERLRDNDDDNPAGRLKTYLRNILYLARSLLSYDYFNAGWTIINWLQACLRLRRHRHSVVQHVVEEDEDDEASYASRSSRNSLASASLRSIQSSSAPPLTCIPQTPVTNIVDRGLMRFESQLEKKKDSSLVLDVYKSPSVSGAKRRLIETPDRSVYEMAKTDIGEADVASNLENPLPQLPICSRQQHTKRVGVKRKDALENYRSKIQSPIAPIPLLPLPVAESSISNVELKRSDSDTGGYFFETANSQDCLRQMALEAPFPDRNGFIVGDEYLPDSRYSPLLVFVNSRSGPQQGNLLIAQLRRLLNPIQVWDLADGGPEMVLESFCVLTRLRILVCGGDGTVSWIISALEKMRLKRKWPPIAILPMGTGNDLARIHGWGGGYNNESLIGILTQIAESYISMLDRWEISIENRKGKIKSVKNFFNYLGVGADAQAALQVHMLRESSPQLFFSRVVNKLWYGVFGAEDIIKATSLNLPKEVTLIADGVEVPLPADSQGIILLNIDSYAGGVPMWSCGSKSTNFLGNNDFNYRRGVFRRTQSLHNLGRTDIKSMLSRSDATMERIDSVEDLRSAANLSDEEKFDRVTACDLPSSCQDGLLDVVSIRGTFHLGQIKVGLSDAQRLCQCREAKIIIKRKVAVQIDGEPWRQNVCTIRVKRKKESAIMLHRSADESCGVETEMAKLLDWAEEQGLIDGNTHSALMKEFSRRIESKTRQRRVRSQDNLMLSLKRAIASTNTVSTLERNFRSVRNGQMNFDWS